MKINNHQQGSIALWIMGLVIVAAVGAAIFVIPSPANGPVIEPPVDESIVVVSPTNLLPPSLPPILEPAPPEEPVDPQPIEPQLGECFVGGCSGQVCSDNDNPGIVSTCEWRDEYACYRTAKCERQSNGQCGWTSTPELTACLGNP